jgi:hypothetical protein
MVVPVEKAFLLRPRAWAVLVAVVLDMATRIWAALAAVDIVVVRADIPATVVATIPMAEAEAEAVVPGIREPTKATCPGTTMPPDLLLFSGFVLNGQRLYQVKRRQSVFFPVGRNGKKENFSFSLSKNGCAPLGHSFDA